MEQLWGYDAQSQPNVIKTHISYLRAKLARLPQCAQFIQTVPGVGYVVRHTDENDSKLETSA